MVQINFAQKQVNAKIVYYGPGMSGKTTNLEVVHQRAPDNNRGDLTSISTDGDRTLFFDYMPLELGTVAGMKTAFQLYTVPGQVYYNSTRKLVLQGVDGVIFVADSSRANMEQNLESLRNLEENLNEYGKSLSSLPYVIQYNKRDLPDAMSVEELNEALNRHGVPFFEGVANTGQGVFPTLKCLAACVLQNIMSESSSAVGAPAAAGPTAGAPAPVAAAPPPDAAPAPALAAPAPVMPMAADPAHSMPAMSAPVAPAPALHPMPSAEVAPAPVSLAPEVAPSSSPPSAQRLRAQTQVAPLRTSRTQRGARRMPAVASKPSGKSTRLYTMEFVIVAAAVGALLASAVLSAV